MLRRMGAGARFAVTVAGFACLYTVAVVFFYYDWLFDLPFEASPLIYGLVLNASLCAAALTLFSRFGRRASPRLVFGVGAVAYACACALLLGAAHGGNPLFPYCAGVLAGIGAGLLMPLWFERMGVLAKNRFAYVLGIGSLASALAALTIEKLPPIGVVCASAGLLACSFGMLAALGALGDERYSDKEELGGDSIGALTGEPSEGTSPDDGVSPWSRLAAPLLYVFLLSVIYGVLDVVAMASPSLTMADSGSASQIGGLAIDVAFLIYVRLDGKRYAVLLNAALGIIATGLVFLPFLPDAYSTVLVALTHMGWEMALLVSYALAIEMFRGSRTKLVAAAAVVFAFPRPGVMAGSVVASLIAVDNQYAFAQMVIVAFALLYLIMMGVWLLRTREKRAAERAIRKRDELIKRYAEARDDLYALACDDLSAEYGLTARETELLKLLAQGRDAAFVESRLYLSRNTVKSYTKSVYAKLGVHSKQELIDLVKASLPVE